MDSKLTQGLLVGSCLLLLFASFTTLAEYLQYGADVPTVSTAGTGTPSAGGSTGAPRAAKADLLELAPAGAFGYIKVDVSEILGSSLGQTLTEGQPEPVDLQKLDNTIAFVLLGDEAQGPEMCAVMKTKGSAREAAASLLTGTPVTVEGLDAYATPDGEGMVAVADETTILAASSQQGLAKMVKAFQGSGRADLSAARQLVSAYDGDPCYGAFVLTDEIKQMAAAQGDAPAWLDKAQGGAFGVALTDGLAINGMMELGDSGAAQQAAAEGTAKVTEMKQAMSQPNNLMAMMLMPLKPLIDGAAVTADGSAVRLSIQVSQAQLDTMAESLKQMQEGMGGGGGMPGGPGMAFPTGG